jgi:AbrB family looped-hinge helix DNA binding protein
LNIINDMITTVTGKNQVTIPAKLAHQLDIQPGTRLDWAIGKDGVLIVRPLPRRGTLARQIAGLGRQWLEPESDPIAELIHERVTDDASEESL